MLLLIDNYDSFTYNLVQYLGELGADVHVHRNDAITLDEVAQCAPDAIVIRTDQPYTTALLRFFRMRERRQ